MDTYLYIALLNPHDRMHQAAREAAKSSALRFVTSEFILLEVGDGLCAPWARKGAVDFFRSIRENQATTIIPASSDLIRRATALYSARLDKGWSLTDCTSFVIMRDEGIMDALTGDIHFEQAGFRAMFWSIT